MNGRLSRAWLQGLKPLSLLGLYGTAEAVPFHKAIHEVASVISSAIHEGINS
jgi:hypothetical protein